MPRRSGSPSLLPLLRSTTQARLLELLLLDAEREYSVGELSNELGVTEMSVRRELDRMLDAGILERRYVGRLGLFQASEASPLYAPLRELLERSVGVEPLLRAELEQFPGVQAAAIFGSWAREQVDATSDVDLLVLGDVDYGELVSRLSQLQDRAKREINVVAMSPDEFRERIAEGSGFLRDIMSSPVKVLVGDLQHI